MALWVGLLCALSLATGAASQEAPEGQEAAAGTSVVGRVASVGGAAYAQAPGRERRILACGDPIFEGDRVFTQERSALGVVSGEHYVRLSETTQLTFNRASEGAPRIDLEAGHVRLLDASGRAPAEGEIATPGLVAARSGRDTEAMVFAEKAGVVSMVCAFEGGVNVARRGDLGQTAVAEPGRCVVSKPREALYGAEATHPRLAVLQQDACESEPGLPVAARFFSPAQVALGPSVLGAPPAASPATGLLQGSPVKACSLSVCVPPRQPTRLRNINPPLP